jgi:CHASE3 domain sensor protein
MSNRSTERSPQSVRTKLRTVVIASVVSVAAVGLTGMLGLLLLYGGLKQQTTTYRPAYDANVRALQAMTDSETGIRGYRLTDDASFLAPYRAARSTLAHSLDQLDASLKDDAKLSKLAFEERRIAEEWMQSYAVPVASGTLASEATRPDEAAAKGVFDRFRQVNEQLGGRLKAQRDEILGRAQRLVELTALALLVVAAAGIGLGMWPALRALRGLGPPLDRLHGTVTRLQAGDRSARADETHGFRELQVVSAAFNRLVDSDHHQRRELAEELRLTNVVREIALQVGTTLDLEAVVRFSVDAVHSGFGAHAVWVRAFEGHGERPGRGFGAISPFREDLVPPAEIVGTAHRLAEHCWREQCEMTISTAAAPDLDLLSSDESQAILEFVGRAGSMSLLLIPIGAGVECLGYMILTRTADDADWTRAEVDAALRAGRDVGRAVLHARLYEREKQIVRELQVLDNQEDAFATAVADGLRRPLASIRDLLELARNGDGVALDPVVARSLAGIDRDSALLGRVVEDLLADHHRGPERSSPSV